MKWHFLLGLALFATPAMAQRVVPDAETFSENDCRWLHTQYLGECVASQYCGEGLGDEFSMSTQRGMSALEPVMTVRAHDELNAICHEACETRKRMDYSQFKASICKPLLGVAMFLMANSQPAGAFREAHLARCAAAMRWRPSIVLGPVLAPPWLAHRPPRPRPLRLQG